MGDLFIRKAELNDIPIIQEITHTTWPVAYGQIISKQQIDYMIEWMYSNSSLTQQMSLGHVFYIAELDKKPIGFASVSKEDDTVFKLNKLYVLPDIQKSGAGKALLNRVVAYATEHGGQSLQLQVNRKNQAKLFYEKQGFTILYEADFEIGNGYCMNDYVMELTL